MSLKKWAYLAEIGSAIAVVFSLIYVGYELNQNTNAVRASNWQALLDYGDAADLLILENPDVASIIVRAEADYDELTEEEKLRFVKYVQNNFNSWEAAYLYHQEGLLRTDVWQTVDTANRRIFEDEIYLILWSRNHEVFVPDFVAHIEGIIEQSGYR